MAGPYIGPRGGKWADPQHTIAWKEPTKIRKKGRRGAKTFPAKIRRRGKGRTEATISPANRQGRTDDAQGSAAGWKPAPGSRQGTTVRVKGKHEPRSALLQTKDRRAKRHGDAKKGAKIAADPGKYGTLVDNAEAAIGAAAKRKGDSRIVKIKGQFVVVDAPAAAHLAAAGFKPLKGGRKKVAGVKTKANARFADTVSDARKRELADKEPKESRESRLSRSPIRIEPQSKDGKISHFHIYDPQGDGKKPMAVLSHNKKRKVWEVRATRKGKLLADAQKRMDAVGAWRDAMGHVKKSLTADLMKGRPKLTKAEAKAVVIRAIKGACYRYFKWRRHDDDEACAESCAEIVAGNLIGDLKYDQTILDGVRALGGVGKLDAVVMGYAKKAEKRVTKETPPATAEVKSPTPLNGLALMRSYGGLAAVAADAIAKAS